VKTSGLAIWPGRSSYEKRPNGVGRIGASRPATKGCAIVLTERPFSKPSDPNWNATVGPMVSEYAHRYTAKVAELRKTDRRIDWSVVVGVDGPRRIALRHTETSYRHRADRSQHGLCPVLRSGRRLWRVAISRLSTILLAGARIYRSWCHRDRYRLWCRLCSRTMGVRPLLEWQRQLEQKQHHDKPIGWRRYHS
jgi:hypothetical protein